jgi:hypothetical protein
MNDEHFHLLLYFVGLANGAVAVAVHVWLKRVFGRVESRR